jgi:CRP-like cAMP-binding protein
MASKDDLRKQKLFEDIPEEMLEQLGSGIVDISLKKGSPLFSEGEEAKGVYMVLSGKVEVSKKTEDGWKQRIAVFSTGQFFGELSIMEKRAHEAEAHAEEDCKLMLLPKEFFEKMETENVGLALHITKKIAIEMSKNLRKMNQRFLNALVNY